MTKKIISVVLSFILAFSVLSLAIAADDGTDTLSIPVEIVFDIPIGTVPTSLLGDSTLDVGFDLSRSTLGALDGSTTDFTSERDVIYMYFDGVYYFYAPSVADEEIVGLERDADGNITNYGTEVTNEAYKALCEKGVTINMLGIKTTLSGAQIESYRQSGTFVFSDKAFTDIFTATVEHTDIDPESGEEIIISEKIFTGGTITANYNFTFASNNVFGELIYEASLTGFSAPIDLGQAGDILGMIGAGDIADKAPIPTTFKTSGDVADFPSVSTVSVISKPTKQEYTDMEKFDASGLAINVTLTNGKSGSVTYGNEADDAFAFNPSAKEALKFGTSEVIIKVDGVDVAKIPVSVNHSFTSQPVQITSQIGSAAMGIYGQHAIVCEGCGALDESYGYGYCVSDEQWESNGDASFAGDGTATSHCIECGAELRKVDNRSAGYNTTFADFHFLLVIFDYISTLLRGIMVVINK